MVALLFEIWIATRDGEQLETTLRIAGLDSAEGQKWLGPGSRLVHTFRAGSPYAAMSYYHRFLRREPYTTNYAEDHNPYPLELLLRQRAWRKRGRRRLSRAAPGVKARKMTRRAPKW